MSDIGEAVGTAAEGGLFARAVSKQRGALTDKAGKPIEKGHFAEGECLNCGTALIGAHCHACGQRVHLHRTLRAFVHDLLHGALHFDGKTWRTLPKLMFKPGELTRRYIEGERARFVSPMALFLFSIFMMFAVFQLVGLTTPDDLGRANSADIREKVDNEVALKQDEIEELATRLEVADLTPEERTQVEEQRASLENELRILREASELSLFGESAGGNGASRVVTTEDGVTTVPLAGEDGPNMRMETSGVEWIDGAIDKWESNPGLMLYKLQTNFYKFSWLLIPLSIPFVWLMFAWKRRFKAYDHAIFVTYSLAFMSLLFIALSILATAGIGGGWVFLALAVIPPIHIYKHLRGAYGLSRFSAFWRLFVLLFCISIILGMFLQMLLLLGAF